jgi:hypothetical protein
MQTQEADFRFMYLLRVEAFSGGSYLLGLLAMIKCSICSYQCDNWYTLNWEFACHAYFSLGGVCLELAQTLSRVALASTSLGAAHPKAWVNTSSESKKITSCPRHGVCTSGQLFSFPTCLRALTTFPLLSGQLVVARKQTAS